MVRAGLVAEGDIMGMPACFVDRDGGLGGAGEDVPGNGDHGRVGDELVGYGRAAFRGAAVIFGDQLER